MAKYNYIKCPHCDNAVELKDCSDLWSNEKCSDYKKQEKILKRMQKSGFNVVTCGICGGIVLVEKENIICNIELICRQALDDEFARPIAKEILKIIEREIGTNNDKTTR